MIIIKSIIKDSPIQGVGLFADQEVNKDQIIFIMDSLYVKKFPADEVESVKEGALRDFLMTFCWKSDGHYFLSLDNDRFTNHSDDPNTYIKGNFVYAKRAIAQGEEITSNYAEFNEIPINF